MRDLTGYWTNENAQKLNYDDGAFTPLPLNSLKIIELYTGNVLEMGEWYGI